MHGKIWMRILFFFVSVTLLFSGCSTDSNSSAYAVKINEEAISKEEFLLYLYETQKNFESIGGGTDIWETDFEGKTAEEVAKESALNTLKMVKISLIKSRELAITLTEDEKKKAQEEAASLWEAMTEQERSIIGLSMKQIERIMEEKAVYSRVYQKTIQDFVLSDADFTSYYEANKEQMKRDYTLYTMRTLLVADRNTAQEALTKARAGEDFLSLIDRYEIDEQEKQNGGSMEAYRGQLESQFNVSFDVPKGGVSDILEAPEGYYIIKVENITFTPEEEIIQQARNYYTTYKEQLYFTQEYEKWQSGIRIEKNMPVWNEIKLIE